MVIKNKKALITGINGQDGSYLAEYLLSLGYQVYGVVRRSSIEICDKMENLEHVKNQIKIYTCSLENSLAVYKLFLKIKPDECYHLAASSFVSYSMEDDLSIMTNNFTTTHNVLAAILEVCPECRLYFAGSSEIFGNVETSPQNEKTHYNPRSVYGISKLASHQLIKNYRERFGIFACTGFTYNHESVRRGRAFVTRKITSTVAQIFLRREEKLVLGDIEAQRDWGYAPEYVIAMHAMLNNIAPVDYVIATGQLHSVKDILQIAFSYVGLDYKNFVVTNKDFMRVKERTPLIGNAEKIYKDLGWRAQYSFERMIKDMVEHDVKIFKGL